MHSSIEVRRCRPLLGTFVEVKASAADESIARRAIERAFAAVGSVHALMSFHEPSSEVSAINRNAARRAVRVHAWTARVLRSALRFARESGGAFDVTVASELCASGLLPDCGIRTCTGTWRDIEIDRMNRIRFARPLLVDFGGIAKGFAVDRAIAALRANSIIAGLVNAGGDLRVFGDATEIVRIRAANDPARAGALISLRNRALATSAFYFNKNNGHHSPIIDGRTRAAIDDKISATVSAPDCMTADALTKIALLLREDARLVFEHYAADAFVLDPFPQAYWLNDSYAPQRHQA